MIKTSVALAILAKLSLVSAQVAEWGQCGGQGYSGSTTCAAGTVCTYSNAYYSQCLPGTSTTTTTTKAATTTTTTKAAPTTSTTTTHTGGTTTTSSASSSATGFVKTSGQKFTLNGGVYTVVGENCYWCGQQSNADIDKAFSDIAGMGATTVRTWGFNDVTTAQTYGAYYQLWANGVGTFNTGTYGISRFDYVVSSAKAHGIRLIVTLTNNWSDYGGMDVYLTQILGSATNHDYFYSNAQVITAYKKYVNEFVTHYVNEPGILGWELANEPRCSGSPGTSSGSCTSTTISTWVNTMASYIKSIDPNHLVGLGDEGFGLPGGTDYPYTYGIGTNFTADLAVPAIDFGTFHLYPSSWGETSNPVGFGNTWITSHVAVGAALNKPVIMEEFGVTTSQESTYVTWLNTAVSAKLAGWILWQAGSQLSTGASAQDGYAIYPTDPTYQTIKCEAASLKASQGSGPAVSACSW